MTIRDGGYGLGFISDIGLYDATLNLVARIKKAIDSNDIESNSLDPFGALIESTLIAQYSFSEWIKAERTRQIGKSAANAIGDFHQELIGNLPGWISTGTNGGRIDLVHSGNFGSRGTPAIAEVKNKHNTMNSSSQKALFQTFHTVLGESRFRGYTAYLVEVIPKVTNRPDEPWLIPGHPEYSEIRRISARRVYELSTGDPLAFEMVYLALPNVFEDVLGEDSGAFSKSDAALFRDLFIKFI